MLVLSKSVNKLVEVSAIVIDKYKDKKDDVESTVYTLNAFDAAGIPHLLGRYTSFDECQSILENIYTEAENQGEVVVRLDN